MSHAVVVHAQSVSKQFDAAVGGKLVAVNQISIQVQAGSLTALVGPDGAGKTTLLRLMTGLLRPDAGQLFVLGIDAAQDPQAIQNRISYMPQRFGLYEDLSVQENLDLYADLHGVSQSLRHERFTRLLQMMDLTRFTERLAGKLSGGMKQKLGLACTLVRSPDLLLLDEPSVGVDPLSRRDLWKVLHQLVAEDQLSVIVSTAYMDEAEQCDQVWVMYEGRFLAGGTPTALTKQADGLTFAVVPPVTMPARNVQAELLDATEVIIDAVPKGGEVNIIVNPRSSVQQRKSLLGALLCRSRPATLEDAFMMLLGAEKSEAVGFAFDWSAAKGIAPNISKPAIVVKDLVRQFGDFTAVSRTSFEVQRGEIFGLLGPNGAGKTTTFRIMCGLLPATSGYVEVAGLNLRTARAQARGHIGYVSQKFALYADLTVEQNLRFFGSAYGLRGRRLQERIHAVVDQFDLSLKAVSGLLPGGYRQRLAMATSLLHEPEILFLDEPTSGIDPLARRAFWRTITALAQHGVTIIVTTHFMEEAEYCDRIAIQDAGQMLALGTPKEVRQQGWGTQDDMNSAFIAVVEHGREMRRPS